MDGDSGQYPSFLIWNLMITLHCVVNAILIHGRSIELRCKWAETIDFLLLISWYVIRFGVYKSQISESSINMRRLWVLLHVCVETINLTFLEFELRSAVVWCGWETDIRNSDKSVPLGPRKYRQTHWFGMDGDDADSMTRMNDDQDDLDGSDLKALKMKF